MASPLAKRHVTRVVIQNPNRFAHVAFLAPDDFHFIVLHHANALVVRPDALAAVEKVDAIGRTSGAVRRSIYQAARWIARRRTVGDLATLGYEPVVRILRRLVELVRDRCPIPGSLRRDWEIFN